MPGIFGRGLYLEGLRTSGRENAIAYGFSIAITASFGVLAALDGSPRWWECFLFAVCAVAGFTAVMVGATKGFREQSFEAERTEVLILAAALNFLSVTTALGGAALVGWLGAGWYVWAAGPAASTAGYLLANGLEYAIAEVEEEVRER